LRVRGASSEGEASALRAKRRASGWQSSERQDLRAGGNPLDRCRDAGDRQPFGILHTVEATVLPARSAGEDLAAVFQEGLDDVAEGLEGLEDGCIRGSGACDLDAVRDRKTPTSIPAVSEALAMVKAMVALSCWGFSETTTSSLRFAVSLIVSPDQKAAESSGKTAKTRAPSQHLAAGSQRCRRK
jgi:hypothetical protein